MVEDENDTRELLERILSEAGCKVVAVASASAALESLRVERPELLASVASFAEMMRSREGIPARPRA